MTSSVQSCFSVVRNTVLALAGYAIIAGCQSTGGTAGLDPDNLAQPGPEAMNFESASGAKAWRDIWGSGQGIGVIDGVVPTANLVARLAREYAEAKARLA